jgi:putative two-component system response regulator
MKKILLVDDNLASLRLVSTHLEGLYEISLAKSGAEALTVCFKEKPDLILLDVIMPQMDGFETIYKLKQIYGMAEVPVIFLTSNNDSESEIMALESGANDFISKPVDKNILLHRIKIHLELYDYQTNLKNNMKELENNIVRSFADLVECKDTFTGGHVLRTLKYLDVLGSKLIANSLFKDELSAESLENMVQASSFHDIGKIAVSDRILLKPDKLTPEEYDEIKKHTTIGANIIKAIYKRMPNSFYLVYAQLMAGGHHERYNGSGYPQALKGEQIPLCCRMMSVVNVFDACMTERYYRQALSAKQAYEVIIEGRGEEFDPIIVDNFVSIYENLVEIFNNTISL